MSEQLGLTPISEIKTSLDRLFGANAWLDFEVETISLELGVALDDLAIEKLNVLKVLSQDSSLFWKDPLFFLYSSTVMNNEVADFNSIPSLSTLEIVFAVDQVKKMGFEPSEEEVSHFSIIINPLLIEEGFSVAPEQLSFCSLKLSPGQSPEDTAAKSAAIKAYVMHMNSLGRH